MDDALTSPRIHEFGAGVEYRHATVESLHLHVCCGPVASSHSLPGEYPGLHVGHRMNVFHEIN